MASEVLVAHDEGTYEIVQTGCSRPAGDVADGLPELHDSEQPIQRQHADAEFVELFIEQRPEYACSVQSVNGPEWLAALNTVARQRRTAIPAVKPWWQSVQRAGGVQPKQRGLCR